MSREPEIHQTLLFILFVLQRAVPTAQDVPLILAHPHQLVFIIVENVKDPAEPRNLTCVEPPEPGFPPRSNQIFYRFAEAARVTFRDLQS